jgi:hypothetical protein
MTELSERPAATPSVGVPGNSSGNVYWPQRRPDDYWSYEVTLTRIEAGVAARRAAAAAFAAAHADNGGDCFPNCGCEEDLDPYGLPLAYLNVIEGRDDKWYANLTPAQLIAARCALQMARGWLEDLERNHIAPLAAALPAEIVAESTAKYREVWDW